MNLNDLLVKLKLKKEPAYKRFLKNPTKTIKKAWKYAKKKNLLQKVFVIFMGLAFLATAILPYIL